MYLIKYLINYEVNLILAWSSKWVLSNDTKTTTFTITNTKRHVPVVTLLAQDNAKLLQQLKSDFKIINWNKYQSKVTTQGLNPYLDYFIYPSFQGVNRLFVLFENNVDRTVHTKYLPAVEIKDYNLMIDGQNFFTQPVKNNLRTYDKIPEIVTGQADNYTTGCLLYIYFNKY